MTPLGNSERGGGPANHAILAQPPHTVHGRLRFTEQGEMMADRYGSAGVAERHLEVDRFVSLRFVLASGSPARLTTLRHAGVD